MSLENDVKDNRLAIQSLIDNAKNIGGQTPLTSQVNLTDEIAIYKPSTGETLKSTVSQLIDSGVGNSTVKQDIILSFTTDEVTKGKVSNIFGGLFESATAQPLSTGVDITGTNGRSKLMIVINAGTDVSGSLTVTGTKIDRDTGVLTAGYSQVIAVDSLSVDTSGTDLLLNVVHNFTNCYITSEWFADGYTISTTDLNLSDVDVYGVAFNQFENTENLTIDALDLTVNMTNTAAEFSGHAYTVEVVGDKVSIVSFADMIDAAATSSVGFNRYRLGNINKSIDTSTDGIFVDINFMPFVSTYFEAVSFNLWASATQTVNVVVDGSLGLDEIVYGESLQIGDLVYLKTDGKYWKADNTSEATSTTELRLILEAGVLDDVKIALAKGQYVGTGFTAGNEYVGTSGAVTSSRPTLATEVARIVSTSINATTRYFDPSKSWIAGDASKINGVALPGLSVEFLDSVFRVNNSVDQTKKIQFLATQITSGETRIAQIQDRDGVLAYLDDLIGVVPTNTLLGLTDTPNNRIGNAGNPIGSNQLESSDIYLTNITDDGSKVSVGIKNTSGVLSVGNTVGNTSSDPVIVMRQTISDATGIGNAHGMSDSNIITRSGNMAYAAFDGRFRVESGIETHDHFVSFQDAPTLDTSGLVDELSGLASIPNINIGSSVNKRFGVRVYDFTGAGTVNDNYGILVEPIDNGLNNNWAIKTAGGNVEFLSQGTGDKEEVLISRQTANFLDRQRLRFKAGSGFGAAVGDNFVLSNKHDLELSGSASNVLTKGVTVKYDGSVIIGPVTADVALPDLMTVLGDIRAETFLIGNNDTGFYDAGSNLVKFKEGGVDILYLTSTYLGGVGTAQPAFILENSSYINPNIVARRTDSDTGIGSGASDSLSLIAGGVECLRITETAGVVKTNITEILNIIPSATPISASAGDIYYDSTTNKLRCYNGTIWNDLF